MERRKVINLAYIYKITNDINGKIYVGKTYDTIKKRWKEHCREWRKTRTEKRPLYDAIKKYGIEHFNIEMIEETFNPEEREIYWIDKLRTYVGFDDCKGYNGTLGGDSRKQIDRDLVAETYLQIKTIKGTAKKFGIDVKTVQSVVRERNLPVYTCVRSKQVQQYDLDGQLVKTHLSIGEAKRYVFENNLSAATIKIIENNISSCCNGRQKSAYGFMWQFA